MDALGLSGGLLVAWNPQIAKMKAYLVTARILLSGFFKDFDEEINIINVYGPYNSKEIFWDRLASEGTFILPNLVLVGEMNFT